jgi:hypothetical protein
MKPPRTSPPILARSSVRRVAVVAVAALGLTPLAALSATAVTSAGDGAVSVDSAYVKANGQQPTSSDAISACGTNLRQQNEPTSAVDPRTPNVITSGSNDYCTVPLAGGTWAGFYRSIDSGQNWTDSLLPGYPTDNSPEGLASPLHQQGITNAGDPVQAWDLHGRVFYMGNAFNRVAPQNGAVWVATYDQDATHYVRTKIIAKGTPAPAGVFNDKTAIEVDRGVNSPYDGNVYAAFSVFQGNGNNEIKFVRSTNHGATFSNPVRISEGSLGNQFADIAVTSNGTVYISWNGTVGSRATGHGAMVFVKSVDGGLHFTKPAVAALFDGFDAADTSGNPTAAAAAHEQAFKNADGPESDAQPSSAGNARDCGSGPFACLSGFVFFRHDSQPRITADPKGDPNTLYMVYDATRPETEVASTSTYNTAPVAANGTKRVGQGAIFITKSTNGGGSWSTPTLLAPTDTGHQLFPDINADGGNLFAVWHDSRNDPGYSVQNPPGNDTEKDAQGFHLATAGLDTYGASSTTDAGATWTITKLSSQSQMPNYEMFGDRRVPFHGDYNYVSSVGRFAYGTWTDTRQVSPGDDPRYLGGEGFDVLQCRTQNPDKSWNPDTCPDSGGLDQDIYGASMTP